MTDESTQDLLHDLARAKVVFQQRVLLAVLNEGHLHAPVMALSVTATHAASAPSPSGRGIAARWLP